MSYQFGFGWAKEDPNDLRMREEMCASEFNSVRSSVSNPGSLVFQFSVDESRLENFEGVSVYDMDGDYEHVSIQQVRIIVL